MDRATAVETARGSLALEGLAASPAVQRIGDAWARGELTTDQLIEAEQRVLADAAAEAPVPTETPMLAPPSQAAGQ